MNFLATFLAKFYEIVIAVLLVIILTLAVIVFVQSTKLKISVSELESVQLGYEAESARQRAEMLEDLATANEEAARIAEQYELEKSKRKIEYKTIYKEAENVKKDAVFDVDCINDDGLQLLNKGIKTYNPS